MIVGCESNGGGGGGNGGVGSSSRSNDDGFCSSNDKFDNELWLDEVDVVDDIVDKLLSVRV